MNEEQSLVGQIVWRSAEIDTREIGEDTRTVSLAFASDRPINHGFAEVVLQMDARSCRLERLESGAPLLLNHDWDTQIGVVESVSLDADGMARAAVRFSRSALGEEIYQDVRDGIRRSVSVGFLIHEVKDESEQGKRIFRAVDWEPLEISIVSVPADIAVGVGRSLDPAPVREIPQTKEDNFMKDETTEMTVDTRAQELAVRTEAFVAIGRAFGEDELARDFALADKTVDDLKSEIAARRAARSVVVPAEAPKAAAERQGQTEPAHTPFTGRLKSFRGENAERNAYRAGKFLQATLGRNESALRYCQDHGLIRAHSATTDSLGGILVPTEFENAIIDLRLQYGAFRPNANVVPMTRDTAQRPRRTGGLTAYAVGAGDAITESSKSWDSVSLVAKKWGVVAKYENELSEDAVISIADDLASEIAYAFAKKEDEAGFVGDGSSTYHGIVGVTEKLKGLSGTIANIAGLQVASGNAYSEIVLADIQGLIGRLPQFARRAGNNKFYCSHNFHATVLTKIAQAVGGVTYTEIAGNLKETFFGVPVEIVEVMPSTEANSQVCLLYGNLSMAAMLGDRRGVSIAMSDSNDEDFVKDQMSIRGTTRYDINVHDVGNASATASARLAGPIVGLITAAS